VLAPQRILTATTIVATHTAETVAAIHAAFIERHPLALIHAKATDEDQARQRALIAEARLLPDDAVVLFTSGSTGPSRGVVLSRQSLIANAQASAWHLGWRDDDCWLACLPFAHAGGLSIVIRSLLAEKPVIVGHLGDIDRATIASLVPAQLAQLLEDPSWRPPPSLRAVLLGGAAAPPSLITAALDRGVPVLQTYGLTETFGQVATARVPGGPLVPLPGVEITAGTRESPAPIRIRGPMLASRYLDGTPIAPELVTADLGFLEDGVLHVVGRSDDVIISGGENIHPAQVEAVLAACPGVRAAAAFGVPDARWGQLVAAALAVAPTFDRDAALAHWYAQLPPHARPRRIAIVDELPRLPSGKLDRRRIAALPTIAIDYDARVAPDVKARSHMLQARE
jgi:O-succinylbenzoic acid--CoA ligase